MYTVFTMADLRNNATHPLGLRSHETNVADQYFCFVFMEVSKLILKFVANVSKEGNDFLLIELNLLLVGYSGYFLIILFRWRSSLLLQE